MGIALMLNVVLPVTGLKRCRWISSSIWLRRDALSSPKNIPIKIFVAMENGRLMRIRILLLSDSLHAGNLH